MLDTFGRKGCSLSTSTRYPRCHCRSRPRSLLRDGPPCGPGHSAGIPCPPGRVQSARERVRSPTQPSTSHRGRLSQFEEWAVDKTSPSPCRAPFMTLHRRRTTEAAELRPVNVKSVWLRLARGGSLLLAVVAFVHEARLRRAQACLGPRAHPRSEKMSQSIRSLPCCLREAMEAFRRPARRASSAQTVLRQGCCGPRAGPGPGVGCAWRCGTPWHHGEGDR